MVKFQKDIEEKHNSNVWIFLEYIFEIHWIKIKILWLILANHERDQDFSNRDETETRSKCFLWDRERDETRNDANS
jgi:hypothetical protein